MAREVGFETGSKAGAIQNRMEVKNVRRPLLRRILLIAVPILIILGFFIATQVMVKAFDKPKEKERSFNTLAVRGDYAKRGDVVLFRSYG